MSTSPDQNENLGALAEEIVFAGQQFDDITMIFAKRVGPS